MKYDSCVGNKESVKRLVDAYKLFYIVKYLNLSVCEGGAKMSL